VCVCVHVCACARACVHVSVCVCDATASLVRPFSDNPTCTLRYTSYPTHIVSDCTNVEATGVSCSH
jgi:class 3 adenylate cyclase